ncbi:MAG: hypothetical protein V1735_07975 [Nanoarchaeota archaeon]
MPYQPQVLRPNPLTLDEQEAIYGALPDDRNHYFRSSVELYCERLREEGLPFFGHTLELMASGMPPDVGNYANAINGYVAHRASTKPVTDTMELFLMLAALAKLKHDPDGMKRYLEIAQSCASVGRQPFMGK